MCSFEFFLFINSMIKQSKSVFIMMSEHFLSSFNELLLLVWFKHFWYKSFFHVRVIAIDLNAHFYVFYYILYYYLNF